MSPPVGYPDSTPSRQRRGNHNHDEEEENIEATTPYMPLSENLRGGIEKRGVKNTFVDIYKYVYEL